MKIVLLTALGVGGASVIGALLGFIFKKVSHKWSDIVLAFAAGVMLAAAVLGLVIPSVEYSGKFGLITTVIGVFCGALCVNLIDKLVPHLHKLTGVDGEGGAFNFRPGDTVTRGDFLAMALISADKEKDIRFVTQTSFADDADIPMNIKSYAEYAKRCGIVTGYEADNGERVFDSTSAITRAEAAVILDRILMPEADGGDISVFADSREVPGWAASSVARLTRCGVLNGTGFGELMPASYVTRAETAELLCNVRAYVMK